MDIHNDTAIVEHEATTSKISEDQLFYCNQRGIPTEDAVGLIVNGYAKDVLNKLPMEFAVEAQKLLSVTLENLPKIFKLLYNVDIKISEDPIYLIDDYNQNLLYCMLYT